MPIHEFVQATHLRDDVITGPQRQVVGVAENDFGIDGQQLIDGHTFDGRHGADRHEHRRIE